MCARSEFPSSWSWGCFAFTHRIIPVHLIIFFKWQMHKGWDCLKWGSAVEVFRELARLLPALSFLIYLVIKKISKHSPKKSNQVFLPLYPGESCFSFGEGNQSGQLLLWILTRDSIIQMSDTFKSHHYFNQSALLPLPSQSQPQQVPVIPCCLTFPESRSLHSFPFSILHRLPQHVTSLRPLPLIRSYHPASFSKSGILVPMGHHKAEAWNKTMKIFGTFVLSSLGSLSSWSSVCGCHWFPWALFDNCPARKAKQCPVPPTTLQTWWYRGTPAGRWPCSATCTYKRL